jgi:hypothetical protein
MLYSGAKGRMTPDNRLQRTVVAAEPLRSCDLLSQTQQMAHDSYQNKAKEALATFERHNK